MSIGLLTSSIQALKKVGETAQPYVQTLGDGISTLVKQGTEYAYLAKRKTRLQLVRISAAVCGIELCYAAETAFVSPILLKLGVPVNLMTLVWCVSPLIGFFLVPFLGSLSDRCKLQFGRRRPFIVLLSGGIVIGLILVPNGEALGILMGDIGPVSVISDSNNSIISYLNDTSFFNTSQYINSKLNLTEKLSDSGIDASVYNIFSIRLPENHIAGIILTIFGVALLDVSCDSAQSPCRAYLLDVISPEDHSAGLTSFTVMAGLGGSVGYVMGGIDWNNTGFGKAFGGHIRLVFTVVLLVYLIFVGLTLTSFKEVPLQETGITNEQMQTEKKKKGKKKYKKFVNEDSDEETEDIKEQSSGYGTIENIHEHSITSSGGSTALTETQKENYDQSGRIPNGYEHFPKLNINRENNMKEKEKRHVEYNLDLSFVENKEKVIECNMNFNGKLKTPDGDLDLSEKYKQTTVKDRARRHSMVKQASISELTEVELKTYLLSIIRMPKSILILCITNLFCWMSLVCYSLYFTDFVGQAVYGGDPKAPIGSKEHVLYDDGVRMGAFGMSLYSLSCAIYSLFIEKLVERFKAKKVYIGSQLVYTVGMIILAITRSRVAILVLSPTAGIMYATLFTMPYIIIANYHTHGKFVEQDIVKEDGTIDESRDQIRGLGTDVALVSSMVFLAQFVLSAFVGTVIGLVGSTVAVVVTAAILSFFGAIMATQYLDDDWIDFGRTVPYQEDIWTNCGGTFPLTNSSSSETLFSDCKTHSAEAAVLGASSRLLWKTLWATEDSKVTY